MGGAPLQRPYRGFGDGGGRVEVGLADLEVDDVLAPGLERARAPEDLERGLGPQPRHPLRQTHLWRLL